MTAPVEHRATPSEAGTSTGATGRHDPGPGNTAPTDVTRTSGPAGPAVPAELRGRTDIPERVVTRIAARAAREVEQVVAVRERKATALGRRTRAVMDGGLVTLELEVTVRYPAPLLHVAEEIRRHVNDRVHTLTGLTVGHIDIDVTGVVPARQEDGG